MLKALFAWSAHRGPGLACGAAVVLFLWNCAQFYLPGYGFTALVTLGEKFSENSLPELKALDHYEEPDSSGYDAQFYAQIAMHPQLGDPTIRLAVDNLPYRARRILFSWTAWALGLGQPAWVLQVYAVQNILCWLALAVLLWRWFPPMDWNNFVRWFAVLFSGGLCMSVSRALVDGPSLLLVAGGMALAESGKSWRSALLLGVAGLGRETTLLSTGTLMPVGSRAQRDWVRFAGQAALAALPLTIWAAVLWRWLGAGANLGLGNFAIPFSGYIGKWREVVTQLVVQGWDSGMKWELLAHVALTAQFLFIVLRPRRRDRWWRIGAAYAVLSVGLGTAVWDGAPGAASRVLLPMTLAFNVLVPHGRRWWMVLLLGNISVLGSLGSWAPPPRPNYTVLGPREWRLAPDRQAVRVDFDDNWDVVERSRFESWRWSKGDATITFHNPHPFALRARISFGMKANDIRVVEVSQGGRELWRDTLRPRRRQRVELREILLAPGDTVWRVSSNKPAASMRQGVVRPVSVSVRDMRIELVDRK